MVGMCVADAIGHPLEFMPVVDDPFATGSGFDLATLRYTNPLNAFKLQPGQSVTYILTLPTPPGLGKYTLGMSLSSNSKLNTFVLYWADMQHRNVLVNC